MDEERLVQQGTQVHGAAEMQIGLDILPDLQDADDVVDAALVYRESAVVLRLDLREDLFRAVVDVDRGQVDARGEDALHRHVAELQRGGDQVALLFVQRALLGHVFDEVVELILGHADLRVAPGQACGGVADLGQRGGQGSEERHQHFERAGVGERKSLAVALGDALGEHFTGKEDHNGGDQRADGYCAQSPAGGNGHGDDRRRGDVNDIGTDQQSGDRLVEVIQHILCLLGPQIAPVCFRLDPAARNRGDGCFGHGEVRRQQQ